MTTLDANIKVVEMLLDFDPDNWLAEHALELLQKKKKEKEEKKFEKTLDNYGGVVYN